MEPAAFAAVFLFAADDNPHILSCNSHILSFYEILAGQCAGHGSGRGRGACGAGHVPVFRDGRCRGADYELPNTTAYNETCAAIGNIFWNQRMFLLHGDSKYIDLMEKVLYNGLLSGVGLDGKSFFYTNAMQIKDGFTHPDIEATRSGWFECSCCPTNLARSLPSIPGYVYAQKGDVIFVNLFVSSKTKLQVKDQYVTLIQQNNYPWEGSLLFTVVPTFTQHFTIRIRIPGWARGEEIPSDLYSFTSTLPAPAPPARGATRVEISINGKPVSYHIEDGYAVITRDWRKDDHIRVDLPMEVQKSWRMKR